MPTTWHRTRRNPPPVSPASGTTERQRHTDGPSAPAPSGGHPNPDSTLAAIELCNQQIEGAFAVLHARQVQMGELIDELQAQCADGGATE